MLLCAALEERRAVLRAMMLAWLEPRERSKKSESLVSLSVVKKTWNSSQKKKLGRGFWTRSNTCAHTRP